MVTVKVFVSVAVPYLAMALSVTVTASLPAAGRLTVTVRDLSFTPSPSVAISLPPVTSHEMVEPLLPLVGTEKSLRMSSESHGDDVKVGLGLLGIGELLRHEDRVVGGFGVVAKRGGEDHLGISCGCGRTSDRGLAGRRCQRRWLRCPTSTRCSRQRRWSAARSPRSGCGHSGLDSGLGLVEHLSVIQLGRRLRR